MTDKEAPKYGEAASLEDGFFGKTRGDVPLDFSAFKKNKSASSRTAGSSATAPTEVTVVPEPVPEPLPESRPETAAAMAPPQTEPARTEPARKPKPRSGGWHIAGWLHPKLLAYGRQNKLTNWDVVRTAITETRGRWAEIFPPADEDDLFETRKPLRRQVDYTLTFWPCQLLKTDSQTIATLSQKYGATSQSDFVDRVLQAWAADKGIIDGS